MATIVRRELPQASEGFAKGLSRTRLRVPRNDLIARPRLIERLAAAADARIVLLQAPAGYGKTSLMQQWADKQELAGARNIWVSLDSRDCDPMFLAHHVERALDEALSRAGNGPRQDITPSFYGWQALIEDVCDRLVDCEHACWLFIDDAHCLAGSSAVEGLRHLIESAPSQLRFIIGTRGDPGMPLGRIRVRHRVLELGRDDLRFEEAETRAYLDRLGGPPMESEHVVLLQQRAEGWIAGIKLFGLALALEPENRHILEGLTGERRQIADFFMEDVLARLPDDVQTFLLRASLLEEFSPTLCDVALERCDSRAMIDRCEAEGLFLQERDSRRSWYRFHHLFADFLKRQLHDSSPEVAPPIYRRAARWLAEQGNHVAAFDRAMQGQDAMLAAELLEAHCEQMFASGLQPTIQQMAERLPAHILSLYPRLMLSLAWRTAAQWRLQEARSLVSVAQQRMEELARDPANAELLQWLRLSADHRETMILHAAYQVEDLERRSSLAIQGPAYFDHRSPYLMGSFHNALQFAQREQFKLNKVERLDQCARELVKKTGNRHGEIFIAGVTGPSLLLMGQTARARVMLEEALSVAQRIAGRDDPLGAVVASALASVCYETDDLDTAQALLDQYQPLMTSAGFVEQLVTGWITRSRLQMAGQDADACLATLNEAAEFGAAYDLDRLRIGANVEQVRVLLKLGRPDDAARFARRRGLSVHQSAAPSRAQFKYTVLDSAVAHANCQLLAADDRFGEALSLAHQWRSFVNASQATLAAIEWDLLTAELQLLSGERLAAQRSLLQALRKAAPGGFVRRFIDEGEPIAGLLRQMAQSHCARDKPEDQLLQSIVERIGGVEDEEETDEGLEQERDIILGRINGRELEILTMAGDGMLNRQIGERLGLTEGTVKWYLQQVYDKIGVRNRKQAFVKARRLGLIQ